KAFFARAGRRRARIPARQRDHRQDDPDRGSVGGRPALTGVSSARLRAILGGSAVNLVEWYDSYAYSAFALYFAPRFFPKGDGTAQLMDSAAVFAAGFLMRPLGAWFMGEYADRRGRKAGLTLSVAMMCAGSLVISVTPDAQSIGLAAPAMLILARLVQGLALAGVS